MQHKVLVVGSGFGCRIQTPALRAAGLEVAGLVGTDQERTAERAHHNNIPSAYVDLERAIGETGATAVAIATPPDQHVGSVLTALAQSCHVLCEKPFARNLEEARLMYDAAEHAGVEHMLGYEFRWDPVRAIGAQAIADGLIGEARMASFCQFLHYAGNSQVDLPGWWLDERAGGGWLGAWGSHLVDWIRTWLGDFESVSAALVNVTTSPGSADDSFLVRFRLVSGVEGVLSQSGGAWGPFGQLNRVAGTDGTLWIENNAVWIADESGSRELPTPPELLLPTVEPGTDPRQQSPEWQMLTATELAPYARLCQTWRERIEGKPPSSPVVPATFADGVAAVNVVDAIRQSAIEGGKTVSIDAVSMT